MSYNLWRCLFDDDVDSFRRYLATATFSSAAPRTTSSGHIGGLGLKVGSPGSLAASPKTPAKYRKSSTHTPTIATTAKNGGSVLTRGEVNTKDSFGRTILHHIASLRTEDALAFARALLEMPFLDLYVQDLESGWTPLHRALYFGNISVAHALMARDVRDATDYTTAVQHTHAGGLVKIKDHEGNSPFEVFGLTIAPRSLQHEASGLGSGLRDEDSVNGLDDNGEHQDQERRMRHVQPLIDLSGDEIFAFGSNRNLSLGTGDGDDRHYPERLHFERPHHLLQRLQRDHLNERQKASVHEDLSNSVADLSPTKDLPAVTRHKPITIQDVAMAKLHTAVLTNDPISNLYICGYGPGGRIGTGDENTSFSFRCIQAGGLAKRRISAIALGQDHSIAVCSQGELFTWGSNRHGQLGYALPETAKDEVSTQLVPRQLFGYIKKETIIGAAASTIHSAVYTTSALYTFGKNEGQLGLMDADARSLDIQVLPRRIGVSILQSTIQSVSAIDRATIVLLESHDVIVFTHYGWTKVPFLLEIFMNYYMSDNMSTRYNMETNYIKSITSAGSTICALSSFGEVFTIEVPKVSETVSSNVSTTNPTKARNALPTPSRIWTLGKAHMAAMDVAVGQDGSIIICTASGSAWRKEKRANIKSVKDAKKEIGRPKDYKFVRIPNLTGVVAVRSNAFGAFAAVRRDATVTRDQIIPGPPSLWNDIFHLLPFREYGKAEDSVDSETDPATVARAIIGRSSAESDFLSLYQYYQLSQGSCDIWLTSNITEVRIPMHSFILGGRSSVLRSALNEFQETYYYSIPEVLSIEYVQDGQIRILFQGADFLTLVNLVFYLYSDNLIDVWHYTSKALQLAARYRAVRLELMKIASHLEMRGLERAVRVMVDPVRSLANDLEFAVVDGDFFVAADIIVELADEAELPAHSALLCRRCPFFDGLFNGRAGGMWMASRRNEAEAESEAIRVDLKHIDEKIFTMVLRHLYADTGEELFDDIVAGSLDEFLDVVIEVMSVANELMLDRLSQICQQILGRYVTIRNVCSLVNTVAECTVQDFKKAALEYVCLNLESMMELRLLDDLDEDLLLELDEVVRANQLAFLPFARSDRAEAELLENHPDLLGEIEKGRDRRVDSMRLRSRLVEDEERHTASAKTRYGSLDRHGSSPYNRSPLPTPADASPMSTPSPSPAIVANDAADDLPFEMDGDDPQLLPAPANADLGAPNTNTGPSRIANGPALTNRHSKTALLRSSSTPDADGAGLSTPARADSSTARSPVDGFEGPRTPWQAPVHEARRDGLKDIMEQASLGRVSTLTQSMRSASTGTKAATKLSQKERKRQQQQQQIKGQSPTELETASPKMEPTAKNPSSPWTTIAKPKPEAFPTTVVSQETDKSQHTRPSITSPRPTVIAPPRSSENVARGSRPSALAPSSPLPPAAPIQSIRHTPLPARVSAIDAHTSMSEILAQQQYEKSAVKEAAAKRSLQEIQQEQEFQEWWDNESKRVQEEDAQTSNTAGGPPRRGKGGRGRGGARRGSSRGKASAGETTGQQRKHSSGEVLETAQRSVSEPASRGNRPGISASRGSANAGRGQGRGRGSGHVHAQARGAGQP